MDKLVKKYSSQFNANSTVKVVAETLIVNHMFDDYQDGVKLTANQAADLVQMIFEKYGLTTKTTSQCISWYKNKMKQQDSKSKIRVQFKNYVDSLDKKSRDKILLELATKYQDTLLKQLNEKDMKIAQPAS